MKTTIATILILLTVSGFTQELNLYRQRGEVIAQFHAMPEWSRVKAADYLEYQLNDTCIGYRFFNDSLDEYYGKWICYEAYITIPESMEYAFIQGKEDCKCWSYISPGKWEYVNNIYTGKVIVTRQAGPGYVTFVYRFEERGVK